MWNKVVMVSSNFIQDGYGGWLCKDGIQVYLWCFLVAKLQAVTFTSLTYP
jgi:hypothetical protein